MLIVYYFLKLQGVIVLRPIFAVFFFTCVLATRALAGDYVDAVKKQSKCDSAGELAKAHHGIKQEELRSTVHDLETQMKSKKISKKLGGETQYVIWLGYSAKSPNDAYMQAWAWCMDQK